jgi:ubiquinone/menaquinone biosynthesis C-methylase UbiE
MAIQDQAGADTRRAQVHAMWAAVADRWAEHADEVDERGAALTAAMLDWVALRPGDRVLELACGPGGAGLAAAERVGPGGEVVVSDVAPPMVAIATARAAARGLTQVRGEVLDLEAIEAPDGRYDAVLCREGLMFAVEPARAAGEIARVLRPGGRVAAAVWGPRVENPWLGLVLDAVGEQLGVPMPPPGIPGPFSLGDRDRLAALLAGAGLADVTVRDVPTPLRSPSFDVWWARTTAITGPLAAIVAGLADDDAAALRARVREAVAPYTTAAGLELPGVALLAGARAA